MKKLALIASFVFAAVLSLQFGLPNAWAAGKVDCSQVMSELQGGKKPSEVAKDMKISRSSVYHCRKMAKKEAMGGSMASPGAMASPKAMASPAAH